MAALNRFGHRDVWISVRTATESTLTVKTYATPMYGKDVLVEIRFCTQANNRLIDGKA